MAEANTQQAGEEDQSMEEILQSIRRIIAEEDEEDQPAAAAAKEEGGNGSMKKKQEEAPGSDILELTEVVEEEEQEAVEDSEPAEEDEPEQEAPAEEEPVAEEAESEKADANVDILKNIDAALGSDKPAPKKKEVEDRLLSEKTASATAQVLKTVKPPAPKTVQSMPFRSGATVEDLVMEAMKPMLKSWLDENLTTLVERIVEKEVKKLSE